LKVNHRIREIRNLGLYKLAGKQEDIKIHIEGMGYGIWGMGYELN
jgi:hypothetical protein